MSIKKEEQMAKSSINFVKASSGGLKHNDRTEKIEPEYLLPKKYRLKNEVDISAQGAEQKIKDLYSAAKDNYQEKFGQKLQAKSYTWEALINLNKEHTLEDVQRLTKEIEKETGFSSVQIAIHRDEGHLKKSKTGEIVPIYNLHAHVTFFTLDKETGQQLYRKSLTPKQKKKQPDLKPMNRARLSSLQTLTSETLGMERGRVSVGEEARKLRVEPEKVSVRLGHKQFKAQKAIENEQNAKALAREKDLKKEIARLRAELQSEKANRPQFAMLESETKKLKDEIKSKDLTHDELTKRITALEKSLKVQVALKKFKDKSIIKVKAENTDLKAQNEGLKAKIAVLPTQDTLNDYEVLKIDFTDASKYIEDSSKRIEEQREELLRMAVILDELEHSHAEEITQKDETVKVLRHQVKDSLTDNKALKRELGTANKTIESFKHVFENISKYFKVSVHSLAELFLKSEPSDSDLRKAKYAKQKEDNEAQPSRDDEDEEQSINLLGGGMRM